MYRIQHSAYCGMAGVPDCHDTREEARARVAERLRRYRRRFKVSTLTRGKEWEILEPEDCAMVPDACGTMSLEHVTYECHECGNQCETQADALHCCADRDAEDYDARCAVCNGYTPEECDGDHTDDPTIYS